MRTQSHEIDEEEEEEGEEGEVSEVLVDSHRFLYQKCQ